MVKQLTFFLLLFVVVVACADDYIFATGRDGTEIVYTADRMIYTNWLGDCILWHPFPSDVGGGSYPDYSTEQNDGTNATAGDRPTWSSGSYVFDGVSDYIKLDDGAGLNPTTAMTISIWLKTEGAADNYILIKCNDLATGGDQFAYRMLKTAGLSNVTFSVAPDGSYASAVSVATTSYPGDDTWHHAAGVYDGASLMIYFDGGWEATANYSGDIGSTTAEVILGARRDDSEGGYKFFFDGSLDDARMYDVALTSNQINQIYLDTKGAH